MLKGFSSLHETFGIRSKQLRPSFVALWAEQWACIRTHIHTRIRRIISEICCTLIECVWTLQGRNTQANIDRQSSTNTCRDGERERESDANLKNIVNSTTLDFILFCYKFNAHFDVILSSNFQTLCQFQLSTWKSHPHTTVSHFIPIYCLCKSIKIYIRICSKELTNGLFYNV